MQDNSNQDVISKLSKEDQKLLESIENKINTGNFIESIEQVKLRLSQPFTYDNYENEFLSLELSMLMIDAGSEGKIKTAVLEGTNLLETSYQTSKIMCEGDYQYNMGNAKDALFNISTNEPYKKIPDNISYLIEAKDHYWSALKYYYNIQQEPPIQLYVNLGNVLYSCNRLSESIQMYDIVLKKSPEFPQANLNRSRCLLYLNYVTETYTANLLMQALEGFKKAINSGIDSIFWNDAAISMVKRLTQVLTKMKIDINSFEHEFEMTAMEAKQHSNYRNFSIDKKICLNEHSIYCNCAGSRNDDLAISHKGIAGDFVPEMELVLNRVKSEFVLARWLYYESIIGDSKVDSVINENVQYLELYEDEFIGANSEMIRNSFRLCFGILDKIALAICKLYKLDTKSEYIYFHNFWKNKKKPKRWEKIRNIENPFILALYTLASDLNHNGQLKNYKDWRNDLEHNILILSNSEKNRSYYFNKEDNNPIYRYANISEFISSTEHLLHLTASAILYFVYLVRHEGLKTTEQGKAGTILLNPKNEFAFTTDVWRNIRLN